MRMIPVSMPTSNPVLQFLRTSSLNDLSLGLRFHFVCISRDNDLYLGLGVGTGCC